MDSENIINLFRIATFNINSNYQLLSCNTNFYKITGYTHSKINNLYLSDLMIGQDLKSLKEIIVNSLNSSKPFQYKNFLVYELVKSSGKKIYIDLSINKINYKDNTISVSFIDISKYKKNHELMYYHAYYDNLSKLPNRLLFMDRAKLAIKQAKRLRELLSIMFIDLDDFKAINDDLGHSAGDSYLKEISNRFKNIIRESDTVSRWGGDEFLVLLPQVNNVKDVLLFADRIIESNNQSIKINKKIVYPKMSIGISIYPNHGKSIKNLIKKADKAMYQAKNSGKNQYKLFNS